MRFIPIGCLKEGMILGDSILDKDGRILLAKGKPLKDVYIKKLKELGYSGLYIEDEISKNVVIQKTLSDELRYKTVKTVKNMFLKTQKTKNSSEDITTLNTLVENIVEEIMSDKNLLINMYDLKTYDEYTFQHSTNVAIISIILGMGLHLNKTELFKLGLSALLHDIGKTFINKDIVNKPSKLTNEEFEEIKKHSEIGYKYVKEHYSLPATVVAGILQHQEKYNGTGYPLGLKGNDIHLYARIIAVADVYDALTTNRPYRKAWPAYEGVEYIVANAGTHFDKKIVDVFLRKVCPYPAGTIVKLSDNRTGIVLENFEGMTTRPIVKSLTDDVIIDLRTQLNLVITEVLNDI